MARQSHIRPSRSAIVLFSSSTWGRADQQTSRDSNRVWDVLFCALFSSSRTLLVSQSQQQLFAHTCIIALPMRPMLSVWTFFVSMGLLLTAIPFAQVAPNQPPASSAPQKTQQPSPQTSVPKFEDIAQKAGLTVAHISSPDKKYIVESMSGGVGLIDCDNDGKLDIITVNGSTVQRSRQGSDLIIPLYHQDEPKNGEPRFTDITKSAGLTRKGWGMGVAVADYDNDGL